MKVFNYLIVAANAFDLNSPDLSACALNNASPSEKVDSICGNETCRDQILAQLLDSFSDEDFNLKYDKYKGFCKTAGYDWGLRFVDKLTQTSTMKATMEGIMEYKYGIEGFH